jgi:hypothetical protein
MKEHLPKGYRTEELLRRYFIRSGYFTVRGVPFVYEGFDVTDIDLWLYSRPSSVSRHRVIVDAKNRSTPKTIERIFWTKGLQQVLGVEQAIVATSDKRSAVSDFGREQNVLILDGAFLNKLQNSPEPFEVRLTEEQLLDLLGTYQPTRSGGDWRGIFKASKQPLARNLNYNAINKWLIDGRYFAEQALLVVTHREVALRMLYLLASFIAIAFDFVMKDLAFFEPAAKLAALNDGLRHGSQGATGTKQLLELATRLIEQYAPEHRMLAPRIRERLWKELDAIPTKSLAENFAKQSVSQDLFLVAKELESAAYRNAFIGPQTLSPTAKGMLGVLLDFWELDRKSFLLPPTNPDFPEVAASIEEQYKDPAVLEQVAIPGLEVENSDD